MKTQVRLLFLATITLLIIGSCKKEEEDNKDTNPESILPQNIVVDIPSSISSSQSGKSGKVYKTAVDTLSGEEIYESLRFFIAVGEQSAEIVNAIISAIKQYNIDKPMTITYTSNDDGRSKTLVVAENQSYDGVTWQYGLTITDQDSADAMKVFWNKSPKKGVAIMSPYDINRTEDPSLAGVLYKIEYSEAGELGYNKHMIVSITDYPVQDIFGIDNLKMFVGKNGDFIDVYGNSNHPNIILADTTFTGGRNYAFVARGHDVDNVGLAIVALPPSSVNTTTDILDTYSIINVITEELNNAGITDTNAINAYLSNAEAPGYFIAPNGFVSSGSNVPSHIAFTSTFVDLSALNPYIPNDIKNLIISF